MLAEGWKENLRVGKDNFYRLCGELRPFVERKVTKHVTSGLSRNTGGIDLVLFVK